MRSGEDVDFEVVEGDFGGSGFWCFVLFSSSSRHLPALPAIPLLHVAKKTLRPTPRPLLLSPGRLNPIAISPPTSDAVSPVAAFFSSCLFLRINSFPPQPPAVACLHLPSWVFRKSSSPHLFICRSPSPHVVLGPSKHNRPSPNCNYTAFLRYSTFSAHTLSLRLTQHHLGASAATSNPEASTLTRTPTVSSFSLSSPTSLKSLRLKCAHPHPPEQLFADRSVTIAHAAPRDYMAPPAEHHHSTDRRRGLNPPPLMRPVPRIN